MTLDQLRIFVAVAELQHVTRAAAALNLTQSAVSHAVSALEARHDVALFHRVGRRIELTSEGELFLDAARQTLAQARHAEMLLDDLGSTRRGRVTIFASQTIANFWLPPRLVRFTEDFPHVDLVVLIGNTSDSVAAVTEGRADLGLIEGEMRQGRLEAELVATDSLTIVVGALHEWTRRPPVLPRDLGATKWALREKGSGTRSSFESALVGLGYPPESLDVVMELPSNEALCGAVAAGTMATVVSTVVAEQGLGAGRLKVIPFDLGTRPFRLIRHRERALSRAAAALVASLRATA